MVTSFSMKLSFSSRASAPRWPLWAALVPLVLAGCGGGERRTCVDPDEPYLSARSHPPLRVPEGLSEPNRSEGMAIPPGPERAQGSGPGCLEEPPSYFRSSGVLARTPEEVVASWAQAWANREADAVLALYSTTFKAPTDTAGSAEWLEQRREQVATGPVPDANIEELRIEPDGPDRRIATFVQRFGMNALRKRLVLVRESGSWRIASEEVSEVK